MKITMLTSGTPNSRLTHRIVALGRELVTRGHDVTMIAPSYDKHSNWRLDAPAVVDGIRMVYPYQFKTQSFLVNLIPYIFSASFEVLRRKSDIIYVYKPTPATIVGVLAKWFKRTPIVLDMDDLGSEVMKLEGHSGLIYRLVAQCEQMAARNAASIVGASRLLENEFKAKYPNKPVMRLPNGVDVKEFVSHSTQTNREPKILFFGMLGRASIAAPLIEAIPSVIAASGKSKVHVEILGDGPARPELEALAGRVGVMDNVTFRGWTSFSQLSERVAPGDIAICITPQERPTAACSNQKVFQYMALSLPQIVSDVGDLPLYVENGDAGVVVPADNVDELAKAISSLLADPKKRMALGKHGRVLSETVYSWNTLAGQLETFLVRATEAAK